MQCSIEHTSALIDSSAAFQRTHFSTTDSSAAFYRLLHRLQSSALLTVTRALIARERRQCLSNCPASHCVIVCTVHCCDHSLCVLYTAVTIRCVSLCVLYTAVTIRCVSLCVLYTAVTIRCVSLCVLYTAVTIRCVMETLSSTGRARTKFSKSSARLR